MPVLSRVFGGLAVAVLAACGDGGSLAARGDECGGFTGRECSGGLWCDYGANTCGIADEQGVCEVRPEVCADIFDPVCGCDGRVYGNECEAGAAGVDVRAFGSCEPPEGMFGCGFRFCDLDLSYCRVLGSDVAGEPDGFDCVALPAACGDPADCACVAGEPCGDRCEAGEGGGLTLVCPGG